MADTIDLVIALSARDAASAVFQNFERVVGDLPGIAGLAATSLVGIGVVAAAAFGASVTAATNFQTTLTQVQNNTTMTNSDTQAMHDSILALANDTGAPLDQLAQGYMHISNFGYSAADAQVILKTATESAMSTGGNAADTAEILANVMHEFSIKTTDASNAMDVLHLAAAQGNMTLEQFTNAAGPMLGIAANLGVPLTDVSAAMSALTRHGYDAAGAATQIKDVLTHIANPSKAAEAELKRLSKVTGIDLVGDFSEAGLKAKGLDGVMLDLQKATGGNAEEMMKLIPALRGGLGAITLVGTGMQDYQSILSSLADTYAGKTTPTADAFARSQQTLGFQLGLLKTNLQTSAIELGQNFLPALTKAVEWLQSTGVPGFKAFATAAGPALAAAFNGVAAVAQQTLGGDVVGAVHSVLASIGSALPVMLGALQQWGQALLGWLAPRVPVLLGQLAQLQLQITQWIVTTAAPAIATATVQLGVALTSWVAGVWPNLETQLGTLLNDLGAWLSGDALPTINAKLHTWAQAFADWIPGATQNLVDNIGPTLDALGGWITDTALPEIGQKLADWGTAFMAWVAPAIPPMLAELAKLLVEFLGWILLYALPQIIVHLVEWGVALTDWVAPRIPVLLDELGKLLVALVGWFLGTALPAMWNAADKIGQAIIDGMLAGLATLGAQLTKTISDQIRSIHIDIGPFHLSAAGFHIDNPPPITVTTNEVHNVITNAINAITGKASGGPVSAGTPYIVGEAGPELFVPSGSGSIVPNGALAGSRGSRGVNVNINVTGNTMLSNDRQTLQQLAQLLRPELDRLVRLYA